MKIYVIKTQQFFLDFGENKASFMKNFDPFGNIKLALPVPSIKFTGPDIILIIALLTLNQRSISYIYE